MTIHCADFIAKTKEPRYIVSWLFKIINYNNVLCRILSS